MAITLFKPRTLLEPRHRIETLEDVMDRWLGNPWEVTRAQVEELTWLPATDVKETENEYVVEADIPGLKKEDLAITVHEGLLTIKGERKKEEEVKKDNYHRVERTYGKFERVIELPGSVDEAKVAATFKDGVLRVALPKREEAKPKQIEVQTE